MIDWAAPTWVFTKVNNLVTVSSHYQHFDKLSPVETRLNYQEKLLMVFPDTLFWGWAVAQNCGRFPPSGCIQSCKTLVVKIGRWDLRRYYERILATPIAPVKNPRLASFIDNRPPGLIAIVAYKSVVTVVFSILAISLVIAARKYTEVENLADALELTSKHRIIEWILDKVLNFSPKKLGFVGLASGAYAIVSGIEAVGLWQKKVWAHWLVIGLVGSSIFPEIYELIHGITPIKSLVFVINVVMLWYLLTHRPRHH
jgi:uncharacterized membrane protein (DUF2068 family)